MSPIKIFLIIVISIAVIEFFIPNKKLQAYWSRSCTGRAWKAAFPDASKYEIRQFLSFFANTFFDPKKILFFRPDDKIMDVYKAIYSHPLGNIGGDACECEMFAEQFLKYYGKNPVPIWSNDLTLGQLFQYSRRA